MLSVPIEMQASLGTAIVAALMVSHSFAGLSPPLLHVGVLSLVIWLRAYAHDHPLVLC